MRFSQIRRESTEVLRYSGHIYRQLPLFRARIVVIKKLKTNYYYVLDHAIEKFLGPMVTDVF